VLEHGGEGGRVNSFVLADGHRGGGLVVVPAGGDSLGISDDSAVVEKHVDVILRRQLRAGRILTASSGMSLKGTVALSDRK